METHQIAEGQWVPEYPPVSQPHFVEERTLLSARPVVPLEQVKTRERSRRGLLLTSAIAVSLLLGACTALAIVYVQQRRITETRRIPTVPTAKTSRQNEVPVVGARTDDSDSRVNDRETRRDERREARRVWREEIRQRRVNSGDDLFRIREIFEGRRKPE